MLGWPHCTYVGRCQRSCCCREASPSSGCRHSDTEAKRIQVPGRLHSGEGETALIAASKEGQIAVIELLLEAGANKEAKGKMQKTALDFANDNSHTGVVALLE